MARKTAIGDANKILVFEKSGADIGALVFTFDKNTGVTLTGDPLKDNPVLTFTSEIDNTAFQTFKTTYLTNNKLVDVDSVYTDGSKDTSKAVPSSATQLIVMHAGALDADGEKKLTVLNAILDVGDQSIAANTANAVEVIFTGVPSAVAADITAATADTSYSDVMTIDTNITWAISKTGVQKHYTSA